MRQLMVLRHAKSDWPEGAADHTRTLNDRGRHSAALVGTHMAEAGLVPELAVCSSAVRARITLDLAKEAGGWHTNVTVTDDLYNTHVAGALDVVADAPDVSSLLLVGHEPTWSGLVRVLTGVEVPMKTATLVVMQLDRERWDELAPNSCTISSVTHVRELEAR